MDVVEPLTPRVIGELLALLAHDLRNPLSALHSNLGFLKAVQPSDDPDVVEAFEDGFVSCDGLNHIIDNLDLLGHVLRGEPSAGRTTVDVLEVVREVVERSQHAAKSHGVSLGLDPDSGSVRADLSPELTGRAVSNVVRNAVQYATGERRVRVHVVDSDGGGVEIRVDDTGAAVAPVDPFTAEGQAASKSVPSGRYGRGLGLYCAALAAQADGWGLRVAGAPPGFGNRLVLTRSPP